MGRSGLRGALVAVLVLVLVGGAAYGARLWRADTRPPLQAALASMPADTTVVGFTDWTRIDDVAESADRDVLTRSVLAAEPLEEALGWTPRDLAWEAYGQSPQRAALVVAPSSRLGWDRLEESLAGAGYTASDHLWTAAPEALATSGLGEALTVVQVLREHGVVVAGVDEASIEPTVRTVTGRDAALTSSRPALDTAQALAGADTVLLQAGTLGCEAAAVQDPAALAEAEAAEARSGSLSAYAFSGRALTDLGGQGDDAQRFRLAMTFAEVAEARSQADVREILSTGPAVGRSGDMADFLRLRDTVVDGATVSLDYDHAPDEAVVMTGTGTLLPASC